MRTQFRGLRAFCAAARHLSFKNAADELCVTASAISHQIKDLEDSLGVQLFERKTRRVVLSEAGRTLLEEVESHIEAIDRACLNLRQSEQQVPISVQIPEFFATEVFVPRMNEFADCGRHINLRLESTGPNARPSESADLRIVLTRKTLDPTISRRLFPIRYAPTCSTARYEQWRQRGARVLEEETLLLHQARPRGWHQWAEHAGLEPPQARRMILFDSMLALARAAEQGAGIALIPMPVSQVWFDRGSLKTLLEPELTTSDFYCLVKNPSSRYPRETEILWEWIIRTFAEDG